MAEAKMLDFFKEIWASRPHVSEISGAPLLNENYSKFIWQFSHILPKSIYGKWKLNKNNIILLTPFEHEWYEHFTDKHKLSDMYLKYKPAWVQLFDKKAEMRAEYHRLFGNHRSLN